MSEAPQIPALVALSFSIFLRQFSPPALSSADCVINGEVSVLIDLVAYVG